MHSSIEWFITAPNTYATVRRTHHDLSAPVCNQRLRRIHEQRNPLGRRIVPHQLLDLGVLCKNRLSPRSMRLVLGRPDKVVLFHGRVIVFDFGQRFLSANHSVDSERCPHVLCV